MIQSIIIVHKCYHTIPQHWGKKQIIKQIVFKIVMFPSLKKIPHRSKFKKITEIWEESSLTDTIHGQEKLRDLETVRGLFSMTIIRCCQ